MAAVDSRCPRGRGRGYRTWWSGVGDTDENGTGWGLSGWGIIDAGGRVVGGSSCCCQVGADCARLESCLHFVRLTCHLKLSVSIYAIQEWRPFWQKSNRSRQLDVGYTHTYICTYDRRKIY